eukprot:1236688-Rhodomonas_salina.1
MRRTLGGQRHEEADSEADRQRDPVQHRRLAAYPRSVSHTPRGTKRPRSSIPHLSTARTNTCLRAARNCTAVLTGGQGCTRTPHALSVPVKRVSAAASAMPTFCTRCA